MHNFDGCEKTLLKHTYRVNANLQFRNWTECCEELQKKIVKSKFNPNTVKQNLKNLTPIQIDHKAENQPDLNSNPNPCYSLEYSTPRKIC